MDKAVAIDKFLIWRNWCCGIERKCVEISLSGAASSACCQLQIGQASVVDWSIGGRNIGEGRADVDRIGVPCVEGIGSERIGQDARGGIECGRAGAPKLLDEYRRLTGRDHAVLCCVPVGRLYRRVAADRH